ncbi:GNAT family N-acetyltransferase [Saccharopolyspora shandongensis]|uniref:GNAT family N-acetyltransferase n=1 Tax=Saccharopolyspora shandongensis TaxID=418495 RepID=UPI0033ED4F64
MAVPTGTLLPLDLIIRYQSVRIQGGKPRRRGTGTGRPGKKIMTVLRTYRLSLSPLEPETDGVQLHDAFSDPEVMRFWQRPLCTHPRETIDHLAETMSHGDRKWAVRQADGQDVLGFVGLIDADHVPGVEWLLRRSAWGHGYASEAMGRLIEHAFGALDMDGVEAWVNAENVRSIAVTRKLGMTERGRFAQRYQHAEHAHETVVLGRSRSPEPTRVLSAVVELPVRDVAGTAAHLIAALGCRQAFSVGDPPEIAGISLNRWFAGPQFNLVATEEPVHPIELTLETVSGLNTLYRKAQAAGARLDGPPEDQPWARREFTLRLLDGHGLTVSSPS